MRLKSVPELSMQDRVKRRGRPLGSGSKADAELLRKAADIMVAEGGNVPGKVFRRLLPTEMASRLSRNAMRRLYHGWKRQGTALLAEARERRAEAARQKSCRDLIESINIAGQMALRARVGLHAFIGEINSSSLGRTLALVRQPPPGSILYEMPAALKRAADELNRYKVEVNSPIIRIAGELDMCREAARKILNNPSVIQLTKLADQLRFAAKSRPENMPRTLSDNKCKPG